MKFQPKTAEQIAKEKLLPEGEYEVEVVGAEEQVSKNGNEMMVLTVKIHGERVQTVKDYIVVTQDDKLNSCCTALGIESKYHTGTLSADDFVGLWARAKVGIEDGKDGYEPKNRIKRYVVKKLDKVAVAKAGIQKFEDERAKVAADAGDDSPF